MSITLSPETVREFDLCDARLLGIVWESDGRDLAMWLQLGDSRVATLTCSWASNTRIDLLWANGSGGISLSSECRCELRGVRWHLEFVFPPQGCIELDCNDARLDYDAG